MSTLRDELVDIVLGLAEGDLVNALNDTGLDEIFFIEDGDLEFMRDESVRYIDVDFSEVDETDRFFAIDRNKKAHSFDWLGEESYEMLADYMLVNSDSLGFDEVSAFFKTHDVKRF